MNIKGITVVLGVATVFGALALLATLDLTTPPTAAQEPTLRPTNTPAPPGPEPPPATIEGDLRFYCDVARPRAFLSSTPPIADDFQHKTHLITWWADYHHWDFKEGFEGLYRIDRKVDARGAGDSTWETVGNVTNTDRWEEPAEPGRWFYRVWLVSMRHGDLIRECKPDWVAEEKVIIFSLQDGLEMYCRQVRNAYRSGYFSAVVEPGSDGEGSTITLEWRQYVYELEPPPGTAITYYVERINDAPGSGDSWQTLAKVTGQHTWTGPAQTGRWRYRVALISLQASGLGHECPNPLWEEVDIWIPTAEEIAKEKSDRQTLVEQATLCARETLTADLTPAAQSIVSSYIAERVVQVAPDDFGKLTTMAVKFCARTEGWDGYERLSYILRKLFEPGYW